MKKRDTKRGTNMWNKLKKKKTKQWKTGIVTGIAVVLAVGGILCAGSAVQAQSVGKQIQILFPEVEKVEISIVEKKWEFNLTVSEELSKEKVKIMEEWIGELYSEPCEIYQKLKN